MNLIERESTPAQVRANRANSRFSTGPRTPAGKAVSSRNAVKRRGICPVIERTVKSLGEDSEKLAANLDSMLNAMSPRDDWEAAWVEDITHLRWRLDRLHRAEAATLALQKRRFRTKRVKATMDPTGPDAAYAVSLMQECGYSGLPDGHLKFEKVLQYLNSLRYKVLHEEFREADSCLTLIFGKKRGPQGIGLKLEVDSLAQAHAEGKPGLARELRKDVLAEVDRQIDDFERLQAAYEDEHQEDDPLRDVAELMHSQDTLDQIVRYETHLETQLARKLRQFYGRRREMSLFEAEALADAAAQAPTKLPADAPTAAPGNFVPEEAVTPPTTANDFVAREKAPEPPTAADDIVSPKEAEAPTTTADDSVSSEEAEALTMAVNNFVASEENAETLATEAPSLGSNDFGVTEKMHEGGSMQAGGAVSMNFTLMAGTNKMAGKNEMMEKNEATKS